MTPVTPLTRRAIDALAQRYVSGATVVDATGRRFWIVTTKRDRVARGVMLRNWATKRAHWTGWWAMGGQYKLEGDG
jgi:hypothetical protein